MRYDELYKLLIEAPINTLELKGNWDDSKKYGWDITSRKLLKSPKGFERMRRLWSKIDYDFDIYLLKSPDAFRHAEIGPVDPSFLKEILNLDIKLEPDHITVVYTNNIGAEAVPATPWTLAHRFAHASRYDINGKLNYIHQIIIKEVSKLLNDVAKLVYGKDLTLSYGYTSQEKDLIMKHLSQVLGTFKSARDKNLRNRFEFTYELVAQYMITNKIKFNREFPKVLPLRYNWGTPVGPNRRELTTQESEDLEDILSIAEDTIYYSCDNLMSNCVNKVYVM